MVKLTGQQQTIMIATPYKVSTITANGYIGQMVDMQLFFESVPLVDYDEGSSGFVWVEFEGHNRGTHVKRKRGGIRKSAFDNQVTVVYRLRSGYSPNVKIFRNGSIHMTGIKTLEDGERIVDVVAETVNKIVRDQAEEQEKLEQSDQSIERPESQTKERNFIVRMINCDFSVPFKIRRKELHNLLVDHYMNTCSYQPETYPGVKLQYFCNTNNCNGICQCTRACIGKGFGNECKKVTIAIFASGKMLITGATTFDHVNETYAYIVRVIEKHKKSIEWIPPTIPSQMTVATVAVAV